MKRIQAGLIVALVVLLASLLVARLLRLGSQDQTPAPLQFKANADVGSQDEPSQSATNRSENTAPSLALQQDDSRASLPHVAIAARVVDEESKGIAGVNISWTPLSPVSLGRLREWGTIDWDAIDGATLICISDAAGSFTFSAPPKGAELFGSVLWFTHPDFEAKPILIEGHDDAWKLVALCRLKRLQGANVRVVDSQSNPVDGARLEQCALLPAASSSLDERTLRAYRVFHRVWVTDATGSQRVSVLDGQQGWWASKDELRSRPIFSKIPSGTDVVLELRPCFDLHGTVHITDGQLDGSPIRVRVDIDRDDGLVALDQLTVADNLGFGPRPIPAVEAQLYHFRLDGGGLVSSEVTRAAPAAGESVEVEFVTRAAGAISVQVMDSARVSIPGATVTASFQIEHAWKQVYDTSGDDGVARIAGVVGGSVLLDVVARGFAVQRFGPFTVAADGTDEPISVELHRAGILRGVCTHGGEPVSDFAVTYWGSDNTKPITHVFSNRREGRFELEDAPLGDVHVLAFCDHHAHSAIVNTQVTVTEPAEVALELPDGIRTIGRIVDASSQEPVTNAAVQLWVINGSIGLAEQGPSVAVDPDGRFELSNVAAGLVRFHVTAPGYASVTPTSTASVGQVLDFGVLALTRRGTFEVRLVGDESMDYSAFTCNLAGFEAYPDAQFDSQGIARFDDIAAGPWRVSANGPNDYSRSVRTVLAAGHPWLLEIPFATDRRLDIRVVPKSNERLPDDLGIDCSFSGISNQRVSDTIEVNASGNATLEHIACDRVLLEVISGDTELATAQIDLVAGDNHVEIHLDGRRQLIRVLDRARQPLAATLVTLVDPAFAECVRISERTGPDGVASFASLPFERGIAVIEHASLGTHLDVPIDLSNAEREAVEVVFDASAIMRAALVDGAAAVGGVGVRISDRSRLYVLADTATDEHGQLSYGPVSAGELMIDVIDPRVWREQFVVHSTQDEKVTTVQVRRLGGVDVTVRNAAGVLLRDTAVSLYCSDLKADVATWIGDGRVSGELTQLVTDASGKVHINGLPRGDYRWSIGESASGSFAIVGGAVAHVDALVP